MKGTGEKTGRGSWKSSSADSREKPREEPRALEMPQYAWTEVMAAHSTRRWLAKRWIEPLLERWERLAQLMGDRPDERDGSRPGAGSGSRVPEAIAPYCLLNSASRSETLARAEDLLNEARALLDLSALESLRIPTPPEGVGDDPVTEALLAMEYLVSSGLTRDGLRTKAEREAHTSNQAEGRAGARAQDARITRAQQQLEDGQRLRALLRSQLSASKRKSPSESPLRFSEGGGVNAFRGTGASSEKRDFIIDGYGGGDAVAAAPFGTRDRLEELLKQWEELGNDPHSPPERDAFFKISNVSGEIPGQDAPPPAHPNARALQHVETLLEDARELPDWGKLAELLPLRQPDRDRYTYLEKTLLVLELVVGLHLSCDGYRELLRPSGRSKAQGKGKEPYHAKAPSPTKVKSLDRQSLIGLGRKLRLHLELLLRSSVDLSWVGLTRDWEVDPADVSRGDRGAAIRAAILATSRRSLEFRQVPDSAGKWLLFQADLEARLPPSFVASKAAAPAGQRPPTLYDAARLALACPEWLVKFPELLLSPWTPLPELLIPLVEAHGVELLVHQWHPDLLRFLALFLPGWYARRGHLEAAVRLLEAVLAVLEHRPLPLPSSARAPGLRGDGSMREEAGAGVGQPQPLASTLSMARKALRNRKHIDSLRREVLMCHPQEWWLKRLPEWTQDEDQAPKPFYQIGEDGLVRFQSRTGSLYRLLPTDLLLSLEPPSWPVADASAPACQEPLSLVLARLLPPWAMVRFLSEAEAPFNPSDETDSHASSGVGGHADLDPQETL